jgi:peptidoglycan/xylan/chitin deacetylase (PgdA/CDA1 family)
MLHPKPLAASHLFSCLALLLTLLTLTLPGCMEPLYAPPDWTYAHGGITRGDPARKQLALIFTGGDKGEGTQHILDTLKNKNVEASFFVTGGYVAQPGYDEYLRRIVDDGHYLGPHSHAHLLYAPWDDRDTSLVTDKQFKDDLKQNIDELRAFGAMPRGKPIYFIPPYEYYNDRHAQWARELDCILFNFTPGSGSHRDWVPEGAPNFRPSTQILADILDWEKTDPNGLSGHLLLLHLGGERKDKMYLLLGDLIDELKKRDYEFVRVDEMLAER